MLHMGRLQPQLQTLDLAVKASSLQTFMNYRQKSFITIVPGDDGVVIESHVERDDSGGDPYSAKRRRHPIPSSDGSLAEPLANGQFQEEDWQALDEEHDPVGNQKCA